MTFETIICPGCKLPFEVDIDKILMTEILISQNKRE